MTCECIRKDIHLYENREKTYLVITMFKRTSEHISHCLEPSVGMTWKASRRCNVEVVQHEERVEVRELQGGMRMNVVNY